MSGAKMRRRSGLRAAGLLAGILAAVGCDTSSGGFTDAGLGDDICADSCELISACGLCIDDGFGQCQTGPDCVDTCRAEAGGPAAAACLVETGVCDVDTVQSCLRRAGSPEDDCEAGCWALEICERCLDDGAGGCLDSATCTDQCRLSEADTQYACVAALPVCDAGEIEACLAETEPADDCEASCRAMDACDICLDDGGDGCLTVEACAESCRTESGETGAQCVLALESCDLEAITACLSEAPVMGEGACVDGCLALDACDLCLPDEMEMCLPVQGCVDACTAMEAETIYACLAEVQMCEEAAITACYSGEGMSEEEMGGGAEEGMEGSAD